MNEWMNERMKGWMNEWMNEWMNAGEGRRPGVMIPIPQYPLYSASLAEYNMEQVQCTLRFQPSGCKNLEMTKFEFVTMTPFLYTKQ